MTLYCRSHGIPVDDDRVCPACDAKLCDGAVTRMASRAHHTREQLIKQERTNTEIGITTAITPRQLLVIRMIHIGLEEDEADMRRRGKDIKPTPAQSMSSLRQSSLSLTKRKPSAPNMQVLPRGSSK